MGSALTTYRTGVTVAAKPLLGMIAGDVLRTLTRARFWIPVLTVTAFVAYAVVQASTMLQSGGRPMTRELALALGLRGMSLLPLALALGVGDSFAEEIKSGYLRLQLTRGVASSTIVLARLAGALFVSLAAVSASTVVATGVAAAVLPNGVLQGGERLFAFEGELLAAAPGLHTALTAAIHTLAATAMLAACICVGAVLRNPLAASATPPLIAIAAGIFMPSSLQALNPLERLMFANTWDVAWTSPVSLFSYWIVVILVAGIVAMLVLNGGESA